VISEPVMRPTLQPCHSCGCACSSQQRADNNTRMESNQTMAGSDHIARCITPHLLTFSRMLALHQWHYGHKNISEVTQQHNSSLWLCNDGGNEGDDDALCAIKVTLLQLVVTEILIGEALHRTAHFRCLTPTLYQGLTAVVLLRACW